MSNPEKEMLLRNIVIKILEKLSSETQGITLKQLENKYCLSKGLRREIKNNFTKCYINNICELLDIFNICLSDFMVMVEGELGENFSLLD